MRVLVLAFLLTIPGLAPAADISVAGVSVNIPSPSGYTPVAQDMAALADMLKHFVAPTNDEFITFIPDSAAVQARKGEIPDLPRRFTVQTAKSMTRARPSASDFAQIKRVVKTQNDALIRKIKEQSATMVKQMNKGLKDEYDVDLALSLSQIVPMPVHEETERTLSYSSLVKYEMTGPDGKPAPFVVAVTTSFVHVRQKVLFLYTYAEESGLEWSRQAAQAWARAVLAANPPER